MRMINIFKILFTTSPERIEFNKQKKELVSTLELICRELDLKIITNEIHNNRAVNFEAEDSCNTYIITWVSCIENCIYFQYRDSSSKWWIKSYDIKQLNNELLKSQILKPYNRDQKINQLLGDV